MHPCSAEPVIWAELSSCNVLLHACNHLLDVHDEQLDKADVATAAWLQVVYVREGVAVWPTKNQRIMGRLSLIKQHQVMFLAWLPYSQGSLNKDGTFYLSATAEKSATQSAKGITSCCNVLLMHSCKLMRCAFKTECSQTDKQWPNCKHELFLCLQHQIRFCNLLAKLFALCLSTHYATGALAVQMLRRASHAGISLASVWHQFGISSLVL